MHDDMDRMHDDRRRDYRYDYREDYDMDYRRGDDRRRNYRMYRDRYGRNYRTDEYHECLEDLMDEAMESARDFEDASEMATNNAEKQKLMKMAEREKEHHKTVKEILENKM